MKNEQLLALVQTIINHDKDPVLELLKNRTENEDMSSFMARMEDILKEK
jgi:hypothetical protein